MSKKEKLIASICNSPTDVRFEDALKAAEIIGFVHEGGAGSHRTFSREGEVVQLNFQTMKDDKAKPYQVRQLIKMIEKYPLGS